MPRGTSGLSVACAHDLAACWRLWLAICRMASIVDSSEVRDRPSVCRSQKKKKRILQTLRSQVLSSSWRRCVSLLKITFLVQSKGFQFFFFSCSLSPFRERRKLRSPLRTRKGLAGTCTVRKGPNSAGSIGAQECVMFCALHSLTNR